MKFLDAIAQSGAEFLQQYGNPEIAKLTSDSRSIVPGDCFVCMPGLRRNSHLFIEDAKKRGAAAVFVHSEEGVEIAKRFALAYAYPKPENFTEALWKLSQTVVGNPSEKLKVIGITGTNGKTTTAWIIQELLSELNCPTAYFGTLGYKDKFGTIEGENTTPFAPEVANALRVSLDHDCKAFVMEFSSHGLAEHRVDGVEVDVALFTNLTQDHLDFHVTMDAYKEAKKRLFVGLPHFNKPIPLAVLNLDDPVGPEWAHSLPNKKLTFSVTKDVVADLKGEAMRISATSCDLIFYHSGKSATCEGIKLGGKFNFLNLTAAVAGCLACGYELSDIVGALKKVSPVPGRFEPVPDSGDISIIIDFAHTSDALIKLLDSVNETDVNRTITVFGCGGDRDKSKRPLMGRAASERSSLVVITSDNPRTENPTQILNDVEVGIVEGTEYKKIEDRREAVLWAIELAEPGDVVVIAGKGHESYQIIGTEKICMSDHDLAREGLELRGKKRIR